MVYRTATCLATHQVAAVGFQGFDVHLAVGVLVLPNDNGATVFPQIKCDLIGMLDKVVLHCDVPIRLGLVGDNKFHC